MRRSEDQFESSTAEQRQLEVLGMRSQFGDFNTAPQIMNSTLIQLEGDAAITGCTPYTIKQSKLIKGKVLLLKRGDCTFYHKAHLAQLNGAIGVVFYSDKEGMFSPSLDEDSKDEVRIPTVLVSKGDYKRVRKFLKEEGVVEVGFLGYK